MQMTEDDDSHENDEEDDDLRDGNWGTPLRWGIKTPVAEDGDVHVLADGVRVVDGVLQFL